MSPPNFEMSPPNFDSLFRLLSGVFQRPLTVAVAHHNDASRRNSRRLRECAWGKGRGIGPIQGRTRTVEGSCVSPISVCWQRAGPG
jgi:hypothetical protein